MATHNAEEWLRIKKMIMIATFVGDDGDYYFVDDDGDEWYMVIGILPMMISFPSDYLYL